MANLTLSEILGSRVTTNIDPVSSDYQITLDLRDFQDTDSGGQIENGLGITNLDSEAAKYVEEANNATNLFYALILMIKQNQAENINADPEQKIFITDNPIKFGSGSRTGQIQTSFTISFFTPSAAANLPDIDDL